MAGQLLILVGNDLSAPTNQAAPVLLTQQVRSEVIYMHHLAVPEAVIVLVYLEQPRLGCPSVELCVQVVLPNEDDKICSE